jgi:hypothetical protein
MGLVYVALNADNMLEETSIHILSVMALHNPIARRLMERK